MARELITDWSTYLSALDRLLALANERVEIYDEDLTRLALTTPARLEALRRVLHSRRSTTAPCLRLMLRNAAPLRRDHPGLLNLLETYGHIACAFETPEHLAHLRDGMILVDRHHALIRFEKDLPRSKLLLDETDEIRPYLRRFDEIVAEGGSPIRHSTPGL